MSPDERRRDRDSLTFGPSGLRDFAVANDYARIVLQLTSFTFQYLADGARSRKPFATNSFYSFVETDPARGGAHPPSVFVHLTQLPGERTPISMCYSAPSANERNTPLASLHRTHTVRTDAQSTVLQRSSCADASRTHHHLQPTVTCCSRCSDPKVHFAFGDVCGIRLPALDAFAS